MGWFALVGGILQGLGKYQEGEAAKDLAKSNEALARWKARDVINLAHMDVGDMQRKIAQLIGSQRVGYLSQGVTLDSGTPEDVIAETARLGNIDEQRIMLNAIRERWAILQQADDFSAEAKNAHASGVAGAIGSVFGGANQAFGKAPVT